MSIKDVVVDLGIEDPTEFVCPFCAREVAFGEVANGPDAGSWAVLHAEPMCSTFKKLDVLEFVQAARRAMGIPDPVEA